MYSFLPTEQTAPLVFFSLCLLLLMYALMKKSLRPPHTVDHSIRRITTLLMFVFILFSFWDRDWFGYQGSYEYLKVGFAGHMEEVYVWIAQNLSPNYIMFRLVVWGGSLCLLLHMFKRLSIPTNLAFFFFCSIYIIWFSYARVSAAMVLVYYGLTVLYKPYKSKFLSILFGVSAIGCAFFFHKSALFGIVAVLLTLVVTKFEKKTFLFLLVCYPILVLLIQSYIGDFLMADMNSEEGGFAENMAAGQHYMEKESHDSGWGAIIQRFLERIPHFLLAFISFQFMKSKFYNDVPNDIKAFIRLQFIIVLLSSLFMFDLGVNTSTIFTRFVRFAVIPSCIILTYFYSIRYKFKYTKGTYYIVFMGTIYTMVYSMYNAFLN